MLQQEPPLTEGKTVLENVEEAVAEIKGKMARLDELYMLMGDPDADQDALMQETGDLQTELDNANAWDLDSRLDQAMDALRCPPPDVLVDNLSGGERRRVALCKLLLQQPDLLLLDLYLPDRFGLDLLADLRTAGYACDAVVITAAKEGDAVRAAVRIGVTDYLLKPFGFGDLEERLLRYAAQRSVLERTEVTGQADVDRVFARSAAATATQRTRQAPRPIAQLSQDGPKRCEERRGEGRANDGRTIADSTSWP